MSDDDFLVTREETPRACRNARSAAGAGRHHGPDEEGGPRQRARRPLGGGAGAHCRPSGRHRSLALAGRTARRPRTEIVALLVGVAAERVMGLEGIMSKRSR